MTPHTPPKQKKPPPASVESPEINTVQKLSKLRKEPSSTRCLSLSRSLAKRETNCFQPATATRRSLTARAAPAFLPRFFQSRVPPPLRESATINRSLFLRPGWPIISLFASGRCQGPSPYDAHLQPSCRQRPTFNTRILDAFLFPIPHEISLPSLRAPLVPVPRL